MAQRDRGDLGRLEDKAGRRPRCWAGGGAGGLVRPTARRRQAGRGDLALVVVVNVVVIARSSSRQGEAGQRREADGGSMRRLRSGSRRIRSWQRAGGRLRSCRGGRRWALALLGPHGRTHARQRGSGSSARPPGKMAGVEGLGRFGGTERSSGDEIRADPSAGDDGGDGGAMGKRHGCSSFLEAKGE